MPKGSKVSRRDTLEALEKQTGIRPPELNLPEKPQELLPIYYLFVKLQNSVQNVTIDTINSWCQATGRKLLEFEVDVLLELALVFKESIDG